MKVLETKFMQDFIKVAFDGWEQGWHERNAGNLSYRMKAEEVSLIQEELRDDGEWRKIGASVPKLAKLYFVITGSGKFFRNIRLNPEDAIGIIQIDDVGEKYRICWGFANEGKATSELPSHLMSHEVKMIVTEGRHRVIYHSHAPNIIALTFVLPLTDEAFTRALWEMMTECPVIFPEGVGVLKWMVPCGRDIAIATSKLMEKHDIAIWAHHGIVCSGEDFDSTFGLMHTVEKSAEILVKVLSMKQEKLQAISNDNFRALENEFGITLPERFLYEND